jgi:hypothetical protein
MLRLKIVQGFNSLNLALLVVNANVVMLQLTVQANTGPTRELFGTLSLIRCYRNFVLVSTGTQDYDARERFKRITPIPALHRSPTVVICICIYDGVLTIGFLRDEAIQAEFER